MFSTSRSHTNVLPSLRIYSILLTCTKWLLTFKELRFVLLCRKRDSSRIKSSKIEINWRQLRFKQLWKVIFLDKKKNPNLFFWFLQKKDLQVLQLKWQDEYIIFIVISLQIVSANKYKIIQSFQALEFKSFGSVQPAHWQFWISLKQTNHYMLITKTYIFTQCCTDAR